MTAQELLTVISKTRDMFCGPETLGIRFDAQKLKAGTVLPNSKFWITIRPLWDLPGTSAVDARIIEEWHIHRYWIENREPYLVAGTLVHSDDRLDDGEVLLSDCRVVAHLAKGRLSGAWRDWQNLRLESQVEREAHA